MNLFKKNHEHRSINIIDASKTVKTLVLVATIATSSLLSASTNPTETATTVSINETVKSLLKNPEFQLNEEVNVMVTVFINDNDEMVVVDIDTDTKVVEYYIKGRLNYKKLTKEAIGYRKSFKIPVRITQSN